MDWRPRRRLSHLQLPMENRSFNWPVVGLPQKKQFIQELNFIRARTCIRISKLQGNGLASHSVIFYFFLACIESILKVARNSLQVCAIFHSSNSWFQVTCECMKKNHGNENFMIMYYFIKICNSFYFLPCSWIHPLGWHHLSAVFQCLFLFLTVRLLHKHPCPSSSKDWKARNPQITENVNAQH